MSKAIAVVTLAAALTGAAAVAGAQEAVAAAASFVADGPTATDDVAVPSAPARTPHGILRPALYASFAGLQAYDAYTTIVGIDRGAAERNPLARSLAAHPAALFVAKATLTATSIGATEYLWRRHRRRAAIAALFVSNGIAAAVAAHNAMVLRRMP